MWDGSSNVRYLVGGLALVLVIERPRVNLQILHHFSIPETLGIIDVGDGIWFSDVLDSGVSSGGDP